MTLRQVLQCAQPIFFEDGIEGYEYSRGGTFFFVTFRDKYFAITAKHCLKGRDYKKIRLLRPLASKKRAFVPLKVVSIIEDPQDSICDWADLAFIRLDNDALTASDKTASWFLDFNLLSKLKTAFAQSDGLGTKGYPYYAGAIDYDKSIIQTGAVALSGTYAGIGYEPNIHKFKFSTLKNVPELNGFSGSPVFKIFQDKSVTAYWFAGVILRGTVQSRTAYFVDHNVVFKALEMVPRRL
jgi:hypothetical protein